jgi:tRNA A37 threonylcarbamoyladenosine biosynthesis protein TsaE
VVVFVEWADRVSRALPDGWVELRLEVADDERRRVTVEPHGGPWPARMVLLKESLAPFAVERPAAG